MIQLEFWLILLIFIQSLLLSIFTVKKYFHSNKFYPILGLWANAFTYFALTMFINLLYIIIRFFVDIPLMLNTANEFHIPVMVFKMAISLTLKIFEAFTIMEFLKIALHIKNIKNNNEKYLSRKQGFYLQMIYAIIIVIPLWFFTSPYLDVFQLNSPLAELQTINLKGTDVVSSIFSIVLYIFMIIVLPKGKDSFYKTLQKVAFFTMIQKTSHFVNIIFFNYSLYPLILFEFISLLIGTIVLFTFFMKNILIHNNQKNEIT